METGKSSLTPRVGAGALTVASGIEDANGLTFAISAGIDFVRGDFIAPEQDEIEAVVGVESVQIGS